MELLDSIAIDVEGQSRRIDLCSGDLTALAPQFAVDVLVVSAFADDYTPTVNSLIGALDRVGVSVADLASRKAHDLRATSSVWLSEPVADCESFKRILCFEPHSRGAGSNPPEVVADIFRGLVQFTEGPDAVRSAAMPLVATGDMRTPVADMLSPLLHAATNWLRYGLNLERLIINVHSEEHKADAMVSFAQERTALSSEPPPVSPNPAYDVFLSYSHKNAADMRQIDGLIRKLRPSVSVFIDKRELETGVAWQQQLTDAILNCRRFVPLITQEYIESGSCNDEFNTACVYSHRTSGEFLYPIYVRSAPKLSPIVQSRHYRDCREASREKLEAACGALVDRLRG